MLGITEGIIISCRLVKVVPSRVTSYNRALFKTIVCGLLYYYRTIRIENLGFEY